MYITKLAYVDRVRSINSDQELNRSENVAPALQSDHWPRHGTLMELQYYRIVQGEYSTVQYVAG